MSEPVDVAVRAGDCPCPGTPHTEEHVYLEPELTLPMAASAITAFDEGSDDPMGGVVEAYLPRGIRKWTFLERTAEDAKPQPVPITRANMERLLPWDRGGLEVVERCSALYNDRLMRPLRERASRASAPGPTAGSTLPTPPSGEPTPEPSPPSLPDSTAGEPSEVPVP